MSAFSNEEANKAGDSKNSSDGNIDIYAPVVVLKRNTHGNTTKNITNRANDDALPSTTGLRPDIDKMELSDSLENPEEGIGDKRRRSSEEDIKALDEKEAIKLQEEITALISGGEALQQHMRASVESKNYKEAAELQLQISKNEDSLKILNERLLACVELQKKIELDKILMSLGNTGTFSAENFRRISRNSFQERVNKEVNCYEKELYGAVDFFEIIAGLASKSGAREVRVQCYYNLKAMVTEAESESKTRVVQAAVDEMKLEENKEFCDIAKLKNSGQYLRNSGSGIFLNSIVFDKRFHLCFGSQGSSVRCQTCGKNFSDRGCIISNHDYDFLYSEECKLPLLAFIPNKGEKPIYFKLDKRDGKFIVNRSHILLLDDHEYSTTRYLQNAIFGWKLYIDGVKVELPILSELESSSQYKRFGGVLFGSSYSRPTSTLFLSHLRQKGFDVQITNSQTKYVSQSINEDVSWFKWNVWDLAPAEDWLKYTQVGITNNDAALQAKKD